MLRRSGLIFALIFFSVTFAGCDKISALLGKPQKPKEASSVSAPPAGVKVVAHIGNFYVSQDDLNKEIEAYNALLASQGLSQNKIDNREKKLNYLRNELVRKYILYQEALDRGMDKKDDVVRALQNAKMTLLVSELVRTELEKIDVTSKEIEDFYNQNKELLKEPEQRKVSEIVTPLEGDAKQVYIELLKGADFAATAKQYSKAPSASGGGNVGFLTLELDPKKRIRFDKYYEVAFSLDPAEISSIFKGPEGYYIIKVESIKKPEAKSLAELWDNIKSWLLFEKQQKAIADLASKLSGETKITIFEANVD